MKIKIKTGQSKIELVCEVLDCSPLKNVLKVVGLDGCTSVRFPYVLRGYMTNLERTSPDYEVQNGVDSVEFGKIMNLRVIQEQQLQGVHTLFLAHGGLITS